MRMQIQLGQFISSAVGAACLILAMAQIGRAGEFQIVTQIVDTFAQAAIQQGMVGVAVGVVDKTGSVFAHTYTFGYADAVGKKGFAGDSLFEIASNTKVFTTNLLGQAVFEGTLQLDDPLSHFAKELGTLQPLTGAVTLEELGDFTGGFPSYAPLCTQEIVLGCRPSARPSISKYGAGDFLAFFRGTVPTDYHENPPKPVTSLPAPYLYSDYSTGLLGLLLGTRTGKPVTDGSIDQWYNEVETRILRPLEMTSTFLYVPATAAKRVAKGYSLAAAAAQVSGGTINGIDVLSGGSSYSAPPAVTITGGGGSGAIATAEIKKGSVDKIDVAHGGGGYIAPAAFVFTNGGSTKTAHARVIVVGDTVTAVEILSGGAGYQQAPKVMISGGRLAAGRDATGIAHIADGKLTSVIITDGGAGYVTPLQVIVAPGDPVSQGIPIWAPAGALHSTIDDMNRLAAAALAENRASPMVPALTAGFKIAETAYACQAQNPDLSSCPATTARSALAWQILPADKSNDMPELVTKNGGLPGFSSQIFLLPKRQLAVVVLVNSVTRGDGSPPAKLLAFDIGYNLFYALPVRGAQ